MIILICTSFSNEVLSYAKLCQYQCFEFVINLLKLNIFGSSSRATVFSASTYSTFFQMLIFASSIHLHIFFSLFSFLTTNHCLEDNIQQLMDFSANFNQFLLITMKKLKDLSHLCFFSFSANFLLLHSRS